MSTKSAIGLISLFVFSFLAGCTTSHSSPVVEIIAETTPLPTATITLTKEHLLPTATLRPSSAPTRVEEKTLWNREPSIEELEDYLHKDNSWDFEGFFDWDGGNTKFTNEDVTGDGKPDIVGRPPDDKEIISLITYLDVSGDGKDDLVFYGNSGLFVFIWDEDHYFEAYRDLYGPDRGMPPAHEILLQDWTNDGIPEIIYDYQSLTGGTYVSDFPTVRSIIHCTASSCESVWSDTIARHIDDLAYGGLLDRKLAMRPFITEDGKPAIRVISEGFSIFVEYLDYEDMFSLHIFPSLLSIYTWSGDQFELTDEQVISLGSRVNSMSSLASSSSTGFNAKVIAKSNNDLIRNDFCLLIINGLEVGKRFGCRGSFTTVEWIDITGDDIEEVVVIAYSAGHPYDDEWNELSDDECIHQRLIAYQSDGVNNIEIANVAGCVIQKDLYGVRLQDYDGDGIPEIFAAPNDKLNNRAYKWDGHKFVYLADFPLEK